MELTRIGPFEVIGNLGSGPRGTVYRARHTSHGRVVAIKHLAATLEPDSPEFSRLRDEVARLRAVVSNHVATTLSVEIVDGRPLIEMESLGESLEKVTIGRPLALREAMRAIQDVLAGLKVLHDAGIIHDNLKPSNVLQDTTTGSWKVSDGGTTAIAAQSSPTLLAASVLYVAPETLLRHLQPSERSDLYGVGMMSLAAVLGSDGLREAFPQVPNINSPSRWLAWLEDPAQAAVPLHKLRPETPEPISQFISRLLRKDPDARFPSALAATVELDAILEALAAVRTDALPQTPAGDAPTMSGRTGRRDESAAWLVVTGPDGNDQRIDLSDRTYRIGRDPQNDIVLPDDTKTVSRIHAELRCEGNRCTLNDLDSQNGLLVNGRRKPSVQLQAGAVVRIGVYTLTFSPPVTAPTIAPRSAKPAPVTAPPASGLATRPAARSSAMSPVKAGASAISSIFLAWWPPKNATEWGAVLSVPVAIVAIILWFALRGTPPAPGGTDNVVAANPSPAAPAPSAPVLSAREQSLAQIRQLLDEKRYDSAGRDIEALLLLNPQDAEALKLKEELTAASSAAASEPLATTAQASPPPAATAGRNPAGQSAGRAVRPSSPARGTPANVARVPRRAGESDADWLAREKRLADMEARATVALNSNDFTGALGLLAKIQDEEPNYPGLAGHIDGARSRQRQAVQGAVQDGQSLEKSGELPGALKAFARARNFDPNAPAPKELADVLQARMIREGEKALADAMNAENYKEFKEARVLYQKAIDYLPDGHARKKLARDGLDRIGKGIE